MCALISILRPQGAQDLYGTNHPAIAHSYRTIARSALKKAAALAIFLSATPLATPASAGRPDCKGTIYLTFDTGGMHSAELIARTLEEENVRATFFLANEKTFRGDHALDAAWGPYWKRLAEAGHAFGNHTWSHHTALRDASDKVIVTGGGRERALDRRAFCEELRKVERAFARDTGRRLAGIWRAPGGRTTAQGIRYAAGCGYPVHVHWDEAGFIGDELPSEQYPNDRLLARALKSIRAGDVVMMHLGIWSRKEPAASILKPLIRGLKERGFCFDTLSVARR